MSTLIHPRKIALIRRNRLGDMICTFPMIHALKEKFPEVKIVIVSDSPGCEVARWSPLVEEVHQIRTSFLKFLNPWLNRDAFQGCDTVIAVKGGFDRHLAKMVKASRDPVRIGFDSHRDSDYYTHSIPLPEYEHQIKTLFRLLQPFGISEPELYRFDLSIPKVEDPILNWAGDLSAKTLLLTLTCNRGQYWPMKNYFSVIDRLQETGKVRIGIMKRPEDSFSKETMDGLTRREVRILEPTDLTVVANLLKTAGGYISPEGGLVHLAASTKTPTVVLWRPDGVVKKWGSTAKTHLDLQPKEGIENLSVDQMIDVIRSHFGWEI
ncbi:MAG: glycosyltransferase family 9 protein [Verrucomicrobiota bacterium]